MAAHSEGHAFNKHGCGALTGTGSKRADGLVYFQYVVAVDRYAFDAIARCFGGERGAPELLLIRRGEAVSVVFNDEDHGQVPHCGKIYGFVKVTLARTAIAVEDNGYLVFLLEFVSQRHACGHAVLWAEVRDHSDDVMIVRTKMEGAIPSLGKSAVGSLPLCKEAVEWNIADGEHTQITVHGKDILVRFECGRYAYRDGFLPYAAKPFANSILAQQDQHFLFDHPGAKQLLVQGDKLLVR